jgi:hypothetical protein
VIPVNPLSLVVAHAGKEHTTGLGLLVDILDDIGTPVIITTVVQWIVADSQRIGRAEDGAAMTTDTIFFTTPYFVIFRVILMYIEAALVDTDLALYTPVLISLDCKFWCYICFHYCLT